MIFPKRSGRHANDRSLLQLNAEQQKHLFVDDASETIYMDAARRGDPSFVTWLDWHSRHTGRFFALSYEAYPDLQQRREAARRHARVTQSDTGQSEPGGESARAKALELLKTAAALRASDIHVIRRMDHTEIYLRIKKNRVLMEDLSPKAGDELLVAMYRLGSSQDSTYKPGETQDGGISGQNLDGTGLENTRIVRGPAYPAMNDGGFMMLRLQPSATGRIQGSPPAVSLRQPRQPGGEFMLPKYGFDEKQIRKLLYIASNPSGLLLLTGPTGSGKTTTIFELAQWLGRTKPNKLLITIEQPVEYPMPWAVQLEVSNALTTEEAGRRFRELLRYSLRMDPDMLMIGEIRDVEVALAAIDAAQTGHFVMSTLHIEDPFDYALRLENMDNQRLAYRVTCNSTVIRGVVAQRLVPILCSCAIPWPAEDERMGPQACEAFMSWGAHDRARMRKPDGCPKCKGTGVADLIAVAEIVQTDEELMNDIVTSGVAVARRRYRSRPDADPSMVERAVRLALEGRIDPASIISEIAQIPFRDQVELDRLRGKAEREAARRKANAILGESNA